MSLKLYRRGNVYHYRGTVAGNRLRGSTGTTDRKIAERIKAEVEGRQWRRHLDGPGAGVTMAQAFAAYEEAEKPMRFMARLEDYWKDTLIRAVTAEGIRQSAFKLYPDAKPATRNRQVIVPTQAVYNHAARLVGLPEIKVRRFEVEPKKKIPASPEWVAGFAAQANEDGLPHLAALCLFMFGTGARIGEAVSVTWEDIDLAARIVKIRQTKIRDDRTAHLPHDLVVAVANIPSNRNPDAPVFGYADRHSVKKTWDGVIARAGLERLTPYSCRHGFATTLLRKGFDVKTVAQLGGWKDAATVLQTYAHALEDRTLTEGIFDTKLTQDTKPIRVRITNKRRKLT